jgi:hypothetical protein
VLGAELVEHTLEVVQRLLVVAVPERLEAAHERDVGPVGVPSHHQRAHHQRGAGRLHQPVHLQVHHRVEQEGPLEEAHRLREGPGQLRRDPVVGHLLPQLRAACERQVGERQAAGGELRLDGERTPELPLRVVEPTAEPVAQRHLVVRGRVE